MKAMPLALLVSAFFLTPPSHGSEDKGAAVARFSGYISSWRQECAQDCGLPIALSSNIPVTFDLYIPLKPGEAFSVKRRVSFDLPDKKKMEVELSFYAVCPKSDAVAQEYCAGLYYQAQVRLEGEADSFCGVSLNKADAVPFPVLMCLGGDKSRVGRRIGITLHRELLF